MAPACSDPAGVAVDAAGQCVHRRPPQCAHPPGEYGRDHHHRGRRRAFRPTPVTADSRPPRRSCGRSPWPPTPRASSSLPTPTATTCARWTPRTDLHACGDGRRRLQRRRGPAASAQPQYPRGVAVDAGGSVFIVDTINQRVRRVANGAPRGGCRRGPDGHRRLVLPHPHDGSGSSDPDGDALSYTGATPPTP